jgi:hypothetical protein
MCDGEDFETFKALVPMKQFMSYATRAFDQATRANDR